jgi:uncharacterized protein (TIGR02246 family)
MQYASAKGRLEGNSMHMRAGLLALGFALVLCLGIGAARSSARHGANSEQDQTAIRQVLTEQCEAWNRGDVAAFMKGYWNSPEVTFAGGSGFVKGWEPVTARYKTQYPDQAAMGKLDFSELQIRPLGPDAALVLGKWHLNRASGDVGGIFSLVFQRMSDGWRIVHDHTSVVPPRS